MLNAPYPVHLVGNSATPTWLFCMKESMLVLKDSKKKYVMLKVRK